MLFNRLKNNKKEAARFTVLMLLAFISLPAFSQNNRITAAAGQEINYPTVEEDEDVEINPKTGFPEITEIPTVILNEGLTFDLLTRIQFNSGKPNYIWQNYLTGAFLEVQSLKMQPVNGIIRFAAYYPVKNSFNQVSQSSSQLILYAFELYAAPVFEASMWHYIRLNYAPGLHLMYQLTDEYHLVYAGLGSLVTVELPVQKYWTVIAEGNFILDYPNFGSNRIIQPFDLSYSMQFSAGVRYSKRYTNTYSYIFK